MSGNKELTEKNIFITGATDGIGRATAISLADQGANLYILCRNEKKGDALIKVLRQISTKAEIRLFVADLGDSRQVGRAVHEFENLDIPLHVLINNAGILNTSRILLPNGVEQMFGVNHLGHFLLTQELMPSLKRANKARIVIVASGAYLMCKEINFDDLAWEKNFKTFKTYAHSKLANMLFMHELARRTEDTNITVNALHPGEISSNLGAQNSALTRMAIKLSSPFFKSPTDGAKTSVYLASSDDVEGVTGKYFMNSKVKEVKPWAKDPSAAERLWDVSSELVS
ncbi:SDR family oxidoreductase [Hirschia maritima]|uniref:SDR family oxidoreductase n=1 Tax=Hirschia maritima TaxID=1121961 RepID=UPI00036A974C|nr:SDR family oxidoreductase [Hirschia maritima]